MKSLIEHLTCSIHLLNGQENMSMRARQLLNIEKVTGIFNRSIFFRFFTVVLVTMFVYFYTDNLVIVRFPQLFTE